MKITKRELENEIRGTAHSAWVERSGRDKDLTAFSWTYAVVQFLNKKGLLKEDVEVEGQFYDRKKD